jgi:hypothetical protein
LFAAGLPVDLVGRLLCLPFRSRERQICPAILEEVPGLHVVELAGPLEHLLEVLEALAPLGLGSGGTADRGHHLLPTTLLVLLLVAVAADHVGLIVAVPTALVSTSLAFAAELAKTTSSPVAYLVVTWTSASQAVPRVKVLVTSAFVTLGSSLRFLEKH